MAQPTLPFVPASECEVLFSVDQIRERVLAIGKQISEDYKGESIVLVGVLKGAAIFLADLIHGEKHLTR